MNVNKLKARLKKITLALGSFICLLLLMQVFNFSTLGSTEEAAYAHYFDTHLKTLGLNLPEKLDFSGEQVPLNDFTIMESLDKELLVNTYGPTQTLLLLKRSARWFPVIEPILRQHGVPEDFKYIAVVESGLTNPVSPANATGYWQLIDETAKNYGLRINEEVDERYSIEKSTEAACRYFNEAYARLKNWTLVAASYNMGMNGIQSQLNSQKVSSYYDLYLSGETSRYLYRILAIKEVLTRPKAYGFFLQKKDTYQPLRTRKTAVNTPIPNLADYALQNGTNYKILKLLNPWLRGSSLNNPEGSLYYLSFPLTGAPDFRWDEYSNEESAAKTDSLLFFSKSGQDSDSLKQLQ